MLQRQHRTSSAAMVACHRARLRWCSGPYLARCCCWQVGQRPSRHVPICGQRWRDVPRQGRRTVMPTPSRRPLAWRAASAWRDIRGSGVAAMACHSRRSGPACRRSCSSLRRGMCDTVRSSSVSDSCGRASAHVPGAVRSVSGMTAVVQGWMTAATVRVRQRPRGSRCRRAAVGVVVELVGL